METGTRLRKQSDRYIIGMFVHILIGILIGYIILHPFSMVIYWFEMNPAGISHRQLVQIISNRLLYSFHFEMTPMGMGFSFLCGLFGLVAGLYYRLLKRMKIETLKQKQFLELERVKTEFLQMLSHEIRTPLNGIVGSLTLLKDSIVSKELNDIVDMLDQSVSRLENLSLTALRITELQTKNS